MSDLSALVWMAALQFLLYALGWGLCALLLREQRPALLHWAAFMVALGAGFALASLRTAERGWWPYVGSNLLFVASFMALRRGLARFLGQAPRDRELLLTAAALGTTLVVLGPGVEAAPWRVIVAYGGIVLVFTRGAQVLWRSARAEYGGTLSAALAMPAALMVLLAAERLARQALDLQVPIEMHQLDDGNRSVLYGYLVGAAMFNFSFTALLVLRLTQHLRRLSQSDPLTGLLNRRALQAQLAQALARARRSGQPFALLALDLDHFKDVNDHHGHPAGDAVLQQTGQRLLQQARQGDTVARTGGEEFVVLMPDTDADGALRAAERMRLCVGGSPYALPDARRTAAAGQAQGATANATRVTVSVGVAVAGPDRDHADDLLRRADRALYRAKAQGRDRVVLAEATPRP